MEEEGRCRGEESLKQRSEDEQSTGVGTPGREEAERRSPDRNQVDPYERGLEPASPGQTPMNGLQHQVNDRGDFNGSLAQAIFPPEASAVETAGSTDLATPPAGQLDGNNVSHSREKSDLEFQGLAGLTLSRCGPLLFQQILEVIPLRSQPTGRKDKAAVYPLPTSRVFYEESDLGLDGDGISWLLCVVVSLNSVWGGELFYDGPVNKCQWMCIQGLVKDLQRFCTIWH